MIPKFAFIFPGQGSQSVGMGKALVKSFPEAESIYKQADEILGFQLSNLCFEGPEEVLADTSNSQPAIFVTNMAAFYVLSRHIGQECKPSVVAGHSLGEYSALVSAGVLEFEDALRLVRARGLAMKKAGEIAPGGMLAVMGAPVNVIKTLCSETRSRTGSIINIANDNCPGQVVVSGSHEALTVFLQVCQEQKLSAPIPLKVSVATHSELMETALPEFMAVFNKIKINLPVLPIIGNVSADYLETVDEIRDELTNQLTHTVQWTASLKQMVASGISMIVEVGPGKVLSGMVRRTDPSLRRFNFCDDPIALNVIIENLIYSV